MAADGTIKVYTEVDDSGMKAGKKEIESALKKSAETISDIGKNAKYSQAEILRFVDDYVENMDSASKTNNEFLRELERAKTTLKELKDSGKWYGDDDYDKAVIDLQRIEQAAKDYKKELLSPSPNANPFGLDTMSGKIVDLEIQLKKLIDAGKGLGDPAYDEVYRKLALAKEEARQYASELAKTPAQIQKEADALAAKEAKAAAAHQREEAKISALNQKMEELRAKEVQAIMEADRLKAIGDNAEVSRQDIVDLNNELAKLKVRQSELQKAGLGFGYEEFDSNSAKISEINSRLKEYERTLLKTDSAQKKVEKSGKKMGNSAKKNSGGFSFSLKNILKYTLGIQTLYMLIGKLGSALVEGFQNLAQFSGETNNSISSVTGSLERLKNSLATAFAPILNVVAPILSSFIDMLSNAVSYISMFFSALAGKSTYTKAIAVQKDYAKSLKNTASDTEDVTNETDKAAEAAEGYLSPIDEINKIGKEKTDSNMPNGSSAIGEDVQSMFEEVPIDNAFAGLLDDIINKFKKLSKLFKKGFWDGLGNYKPVLDELQKDITSIGRSLKDIFASSEVSQAADNFVNTLAYSLGQITGSFARIGLTIAQNLVGGIEKYLKQNVGRIKQYLVTMLDVGTEIANMAGNFAVALADVFSVFGNDTAQQISADIIGIFVEIGMLVSENAAKLGRDILNMITLPFIENKDKIKDAIAGTLEVIEPLTNGLLIAVQTIRDAVSQLYDQHLKPLFDSIASGLSAILGRVLDGYNNYILPVLQGLAEKFQELMAGPFGIAIGQIQEFLGKVIDAVKMLWENVLVPFFSWLFENIFPVLAPLIQGIGDVALNVLELIIKTIGNIADALGGVIDFMVGIFTGDWKRAWDGIKTIFSGTWAIIQDILTTAWETIKTIVQTGLNVVKKAITTIWNGIKTFTSTIWNGIKTKVSEVWNILKTTAVTVFTEIKTKINGVWESIKTKVKTVWDWISDKVIGVGENIRDTVSGAFQTLRDNVSNAFEGLVNMIKTPINNMISLVNGLIQKINNAASMIEGVFSFSYDFTNPFTGTRHWGNYGLSLPRVPTIPYLAKGAVIPPNAPFTAVVGDQRHGTNIEAPLETIKQALSEVMTQNGGGGTYRVSAEVSGRTLLDIVIDEAELRRRRNGRNPFELA